MTECIVYLNGNLVPESEAHISIYDTGIVQGATVAEMTRTFKHQPFRLDDHLDRLFRSLRYAEFDIGMSPKQLKSITLEVLGHNVGLIPADGELGIVHFVTAGELQGYVGSAGCVARTTPTVCVHTFSINYHIFAEKIKNGAHAVTAVNRHVPPQCVDPKIKCRSRMHWYLAERQVRLVDPDAICLALDLDGNVTEASGSNILILDRGTLVSPPRHHILPGVSRETVIELATELGIPFEERPIQIHDVVNADEAYSTTTPYSICALTRMNGIQIGDGKPGPVYHQIVEAWSERVGVHIANQIIDGAAKGY